MRQYQEGVPLPVLVHVLYVLLHLPRQLLLFLFLSFQIFSLFPLLFRKLFLLFFLVLLIADFRLRLEVLQSSREQGLKVLSVFFVAHESIVYRVWRLVELQSLKERDHVRVLRIVIQEVLANERVGKVYKPEFLVGRVLQDVVEELVKDLQAETILFLVVTALVLKFGKEGRELLFKRNRLRHFIK